MCTLKVAAAAALFGLVAASSAAVADSPAAGSGVGTPVAEGELARYFAIQPAGDGLPAGSGTVEAGAKVYGEKCAACHGEKLQGIATAGAAALVGGRGTLATPKPVKTVESYWPYATTLYDYVWRAMPFSDPGSLTPDEVYAVTAFILAKGGVIPEDATMDAKSLPKVEMPNARNFYDGRGPDLESYRRAETR
jgi:cytochrome c